MEAFMVKGARRGEYLEFFDRNPADSTKPVEEFSVRIVDMNLSASTRVFAGHSGFNSHPAPFFAEMSRQWKIWEDELIWESIEHELNLGATYDRFGHIYLCVALRSGIGEWEWSIRSIVTVEAGQLERLARDAAVFFGEPC
ncbi:MAG TPA: DUF6228 family protein [Gemmataceae bacterium]|nr:DUF6228 family protein [Gemmataceae bacterium]